MTENILTQNSQKIKEHKELNKQLSLSEDIEFWQDKLLQIKLTKVKEDKDYEKKIRSIEFDLDKVRTRNYSLKDEVAEINRLLTVLQSEDQSNKNKLSEIREQTQNLELENNELFNESCQKYNYMRNMQHNPDFLLNHILKFDPDTLKDLCIRLNKLAEEKVHQFMKMQQQQFYNQMMMNPQGGMFYPHGVPVNMPNMPPGFYGHGQNPEQNENDQKETDFDENTN
jgi:hypothetical protein